jgi:hypothetical protein
MGPEQFGGHIPGQPGGPGGRAPGFNGQRQGQGPGQGPKQLPMAGPAGPLPAYTGPPATREKSALVFANKAYIKHFNLFVLLLLNMKLLYYLLVVISPECKCAVNWKRSALISSLVITSLIILMILIGIQIPVPVIMLYFMCILIFIVSGYLFTRDIENEANKCNCAIHSDLALIKTLIILASIVFVFGIIFFGIITVANK